MAALFAPRVPSQREDVRCCLGSQLEKAAPPLLAPGQDLPATLASGLRFAGKSFWVQGAWIWAPRCRPGPWGWWPRDCVPRGGHGVLLHVIVEHRGPYGLEASPSSGAFEGSAPTALSP